MRSRFFDGVTRSCSVIVLLSSFFLASIGDAGTISGVARVNANAEYPDGSIKVRTTFTKSGVFQLIRLSRSTYDFSNANIEVDSYPGIFPDLGIGSFFYEFFPESPATGATIFGFDSLFFDPDESLELGIDVRNRLDEGPNQIWDFFPGEFTASFRDVSNELDFEVSSEFRLSPDELDVAIAPFAIARSSFIQLPDFDIPIATFPQLLFLGGKAKQIPFILTNNTGRSWSGFELQLSGRDVLGNPYPLSGFESYTGPGSASYLGDKDGFFTILDVDLAAPLTNPEHLIFNVDIDAGPDLQSLDVFLRARAADQVVPEPGSLSIFGIGTLAMAGIAIVRRRTRHLRSADCPACQ